MQACPSRHTFHSFPSSSGAWAAHLCASRDWDCRSSDFRLGSGTGEPLGALERGRRVKAKYFSAVSPAPQPAGSQPSAEVFHFSLGGPPQASPHDHLQLWGTVFCPFSAAPGVVSTLLVASQCQGTPVASPHPARILVNDIFIKPSPNPSY